MTEPTLNTAHIERCVSALESGFDTPPAQMALF